MGLIQLVFWESFWDRNGETKARSKAQIEGGVSNTTRFDSADLGCGCPSAPEPQTCVGLFAEAAIQSMVIRAARTTPVHFAISARR
jgi:hypothetical protein